MFRKTSLVFILVVLSACTIRSNAQDQQTIELSDGRKLELLVTDSGSQRWYKTADGYAVVRTPDRYEYAFQSEQGGLIASGILVGSIKSKLPFPASIRPTSDFLQKQRQSAGVASSPPNPNPIEVKQADGSTLRVKLKGGPAYNWYENDEGFSIVVVKGSYEYALLNRNNALVGSGLEVGTVEPEKAGIKQGLKPRD
jgi:hypothetical protein